MTNRQSNRALMASGLSLVLCLAMLIGTTFAWFSDSVSNKGNKITAGNLKIGFYSAEEEDTTLPAIGSTTADNPKIGKWTDLKFSNSPIFTMGTSRAPAQPGDQLTKYIAIRNEGNLELKYYLDFIVDDSGLGDTVTFDFTRIAPTAEAIQSFSGSQLSDQKVNGSSSVKGEYAIYKMTLTFLESAGNTYQGGSFTVDLNLTATQNKQGARDSLIRAKDETAFENAPANSTFVLQKNITLTKDVTLDFCNIDLNGYTLDLANHTFKIENLTGIGTADIEGGTVKNGTITVNVPNGTINAYDKYNSTKFDIQAVAPHSFHFFGKSTGEISIAAGLLVIESGASISKVVVPDTAQEVSVQNKGTLTSLNNNSSEPVDLVVSDGGNTPAITGNTDLVNNNFSGGKGTADSPYEITTATQLSYVSTDLNASYKLMNDLDLKGISFSKIGKASRLSSSVSGTPFSGVFDGNGKTISNLTIKETSGGVGLFSGIKGENAVVKNLSIASSSISGGSQTGAIAGLITGGAIIQNCTVDAKTTVTASSSGDAGGIVGQGVGSDKANAQSKLYAKVENCTNNATVSAPGAGGAGIVGKFNYAISGVNGELQIVNCTNNGTITALYSGGIGGFCAGNLIENCTNTGKITGTGAQPAGGIVANLLQSTIKNCRNSGEIVNNSGFAGGIGGYVQDTTTVNIISGCENTGKILGTEAGGIAGSFGMRIDDCINQGEVTGTTYSGGIIGMSNNSTVSACINKGTVKGKDYVGGICGNSSKNILDNCTNEGPVVGTGNYVGGITGISAIKGAKVTSCTNNAQVKGASLVGGIIGQLSYTMTELDGNTNNGAVEGNENIGGVIGKYASGTPVSQNANAPVKNCENTGNVKGNKNVGGFMGSTELRSAGGDTIFTNCKTTSTSITGTTNTGAFVGLTVEKTTSVAGTQDNIFFNCTYNAVGNLPAIGLGIGGLNITQA